MDEQEPVDVAYVFSGYAPLSVRLIQCAAASSTKDGPINGWKGIEDVVKGLPGAGFDEVQKEEGDQKMRSECIHTALSVVNGRLADVLLFPENDGPSQIPTTIVCYLGGVTYAEIAAIRFLASQTTSKIWVSLLLSYSS